MKKALTAAITLAGSLGYAGAANAVNVNPDGTGQVLLYSYYTTENGNDTLLNITNTTDYPKAVKVRILEAMNSQEVLDFNLYLSEEDVWTASISRTEDGAKISTADNSCTVPSIPASGVEFRNFEYEGDDYDDNEGGPQGLDRTRSGYVEVIEMGEIIDQDFPVPNTVPTQFFNVHDWVTHAANGVPTFCAGLSIFWSPNGEGNLWADPEDDIPPYPWWSDVGGFAMLGPTGGLYGSAIIVNVEGGTDVAYDAVALDNFYEEDLIQNIAFDPIACEEAGGEVGNPEDGLFCTPVLGVGATPNHTPPGNLLPSLNQAEGSIANLPNGDVFYLASARPAVDLVSAVLMKTALMNDYLTVEALAASTDWVVTFPTKRFYINEWLDDFEGSYSGGSYPLGYQDDDDNSDDVPDFRTVLALMDADEGNTDGLDEGDIEILNAAGYGPFVTWWTDEEIGGVEGSACEEVVFDYWDQEEQFPFELEEIDFSPQRETNPGADFICYEANVISVNGSDILGSPYTRSELNLADGWDAGWIRLSLGVPVGEDNIRPILPADNGEMWGLPAIGFAVQAFVNGDVGGLLSNYAGLTNHKAETFWDLTSRD